MKCTLEEQDANLPIWQYRISIFPQSRASPHHPIASNLAPSHARLLSLVDGSRPRQPRTASIWSECLCALLIEKLSYPAEQRLERQDGRNTLHPA
ncbi:hypothetical protein BDY17DRAFT_305086 [Neohortaea acidophila]|uniref:Uncharacterized protein n=1 Tax=Neohortaea acidophila TaxID=245834 RepID=A0A6A6PHG2_9PEZI|nr:uncharacterized protein BDY17DRAFT_305086 [Neohortaea acidophila]KAF2479164.1 hypothetical protein BDY17DRAFT_305086 [Neohortaea acidophila]